MDRTYKRWIFTKLTEFSPTGTLRVSQILAELFDPAYVLQPSDPLATPKDIIKEDGKLSGVSLAEANEMSAQFGLWAKLTDVAPIGGSIEGTKRKAQSQRWHFESIESKIIASSPEFVNAAPRHGDVPAKLKKWFFKRRVYMITGVRIVHGPCMKRADEELESGKGTAQGSETGQGVPVNVGMGGEGLSKSSKKEAFASASDFVFAYRQN